MRNINSEVEEVNEVKEVEDSESRDLSSQGVRMVGGGLGFSFTSFTSLAFTGVYA